MADDADDTYVRTRRQLRGVAESLIAGPQHRASGTIRLAVRPDGFTGTTLPIAVRGAELVWPDGSTPLAGPVSLLAEAVGVSAGPPAGVYRIVDPLPAAALLDIDVAAAEWVHRCHYAGGYAITHVLPEQRPVLWPEHFDVAATQGDVNFGVSAGDDDHRGPYAYVGPPEVPSGPFWNAPFGALSSLNRDEPVEALVEHIVDFFERGRAALAAPPEHRAGTDR